MKFYKIHFRTTIQLNQQQQKLPNNVKISTTKKANYLEVDFFFFLNNLWVPEKIANYNLF